jgi:hypothetical protein
MRQYQGTVGIAVAWPRKRAGRQVPYRGLWNASEGTDMGKIFLVVPDAPPEDVAQLKASRTVSGKGIRLGVLDNSKGNADHLLAFIVEGVKKEFKVTSVAMKRKPASSAAATTAILDELEKEADVVVSAMAD